MLLAYHNKAAIKTKTVNAMKADIRAERLQPGHYWNGKDGCFVGCVIRGSAHSKFEDQIGVPRLLAQLGDKIYEGLGTPTEKQKFAVDFLSAIPVGADLSSVWPQFAVFILADKDHGVINFTKNEKTKKSIRDVADLYQRIINGEKIDANTWLAARKTAAAYADYAAAYAAYAAAYAAYAYAAYAYAAYADADAYAAHAAHAAAHAAHAAAYADADAYAAHAARSRHYAALADKLIQLFKKAPVLKKAA